MHEALIDRLRQLQTRLSVWPAAELDEVQFHDAADFMHYVGQQIQLAADALTAIDATVKRD
jgi:hypothetical protein